MWSGGLPHCLFHFWLPESLNMNQVENDFKIDKGLHKSFPASHCHGNNPLRHEIVCWRFLFCFKITDDKNPVILHAFLWILTARNGAPRRTPCTASNPWYSLHLWNFRLSECFIRKKKSHRTILASPLFLGITCWQAVHANACGKHSSHAVGSPHLFTVHSLVTENGCGFHPLSVKLDWACSSEAEHLPGTCEALGSTLRTEWKCYKHKKV